MGSKKPMQKNKETPKMLAVKKEEFYEGPIPHPNMFKAYEEVLSGSADRILKMSEEQSRHRQEMEKIDLKASRLFMILGLCFAFFITIFGIGCGIFLIYNDKDGSGFAIIIGEISILVGAFLYKKKQDK
ncbi:DUF2335 domain-containing protein [Fusobacterium ulcerans]|uniref:DUF2335 domain-containing protein n=1 Tax=Fusobacterium ulcerans TaxID=861 RepID=UPI0026DB93C2|nr:DUF2335 domain-containing protein [Fusobacterium ulcerans]